MVKEKNAVYLGLAPHLFDQATDFGVIYDFYALWKRNEDFNGITSYRSFFFASLSVVILHRFISTVAIYRLTRAWQDAVLQLLDLMMVKAIWVNYKLDVNEKANPQRFLEILVSLHSNSLLYK